MQSIFAAENHRQLEKIAAENHDQLEKVAPENHHQMAWYLGLIVTLIKRLNRFFSWGGSRRNRWISRSGFAARFRCARSLLQSPPRGCRYPFGSEQLDGSRWDSVTEWIVGVVPYADIDGEFNELF